jgi:hypothetical protein
MFNFTVKRTSSAIYSISCSLLNSTALVTFKNGRTYAYTNVSKRSILNLYFNRNMSLGFWVNDNCLEDARVAYTQLGAFAA